ncbi:MAG: histidine--tRNA ligase [bacterium]|nr:histidine--tRNA ligase [bacterium]
MSEPRIIQPRTLKGFRDFMPDAMQAREWLIDTARSVFRSYGYAPIDTPALEYSEILLGKGGTDTDRQLYRFDDNGGRDVAMRFDLTVPLARFAAQHIGQLGIPFKRYHVGPVWRAENTQRGRYREFMQCDFDTIGTDSMVADTETVLVIHDTFAALNVGEFSIHINNRKILAGLLAELELADRSVDVLRAIDKLPKIGRDAVATELRGEAGATPTQAETLLAAVAVTGTDQRILEQIGRIARGAADEGVAALTAVFDGLAAADVPANRAKVDISIARGLDYYTGSVFETFLAEIPDIGSVCSGGRYDDLASLYTKQLLPGVGASLGIDRLLAALEDIGRIHTTAASAPILMTLFDADRASDYIAVAAMLRRDGLAVEVYPDGKKLGAQLKYADRKGHRLAVIIGDNEWEAGSAQVKDMTTGDSHTVDLADLASQCRQLLDGSHP